MLWHVMPNYIDMMYSVLLQCSVNAEIRAVDSQSDLRIIVVINSDIYLFVCLICRKMTDSIDRRFTFEITALERLTYKKLLFFCHFQICNFLLN